MREPIGKVGTNLRLASRIGAGADENKAMRGGRPEVEQIAVPESVASFWIESGKRHHKINDLWENVCV
jgi:hypothetical protein